MIIILPVLQIFGTVSPPPGVAIFNAQAGGPDGIGIVIFASNLIKVITIIAGLFGLFNIIGAGYTYLNSAGNAKATEQAMQQLSYSLIGLILIVGSFAITAIISFLLFGDATFILNPVIPTAVP
ncbi:MAG: hypothetical protein ABI758_05105 [Candidatus Woesebacteria bacterium]